METSSKSLSVVVNERHITTKDVMVFSDGDVSEELVSRCLEKISTIPRSVEMVVSTVMCDTKNKFMEDEIYAAYDLILMRATVYSSCQTYYEMLQGIENNRLSLIDLTPEEIFNVDTDKRYWFNLLKLAPKKLREAYFIRYRKSAKTMESIYTARRNTIYRFKIDKEHFCHGYCKSEERIQFRYTVILGHHCILYSDGVYFYIQLDCGEKLLRTNTKFVEDNKLSCFISRSRIYDDILGMHDFVSKVFILDLSVATSLTRIVKNNELRDKFLYLNNEQQSLVINRVLYYMPYDALNLHDLKDDVNVYVRLCVYMHKVLTPLRCSTAMSIDTESNTLYASAIIDDDCNSYIIAGLGDRTLIFVYDDEAYKNLCSLGAVQYAKLQLSCIKAEHDIYSGIESKFSKYRTHSQNFVLEGNCSREQINIGAEFMNFYPLSYIIFKNRILINLNGVKFLVPATMENKDYLKKLRLVNLMEDCKDEFLLRLKGRSIY